VEIAWVVAARDGGPERLSPNRGIPNENTIHRPSFGQFTAFFCSAHGDDMHRGALSVDALSVERRQIGNLLRVDGINGIVGAGVFKTEPLKQLIEHYTADALLNAIAVEQRKGRFLFVVTTNLDAQRAVIWNMTAIAASKHPARLDLFRRVLIASASIPGMFAPTFIDVESDGKRFAEMHVDGGVISNVLSVPEALLLAKLPNAARKACNGAPTAKPWKPAKPYRRTATSD
jgi:hypothetical protein